MPSCIRLSRPLPRSQQHPLQCGTSRRLGSNLHHNRLAIAFAALRQPFPKRVREMSGLDAQASLHLSVRDRQSVVKFR